MLLQQLVNGLTLGTTYALIALGYTMVYGIIQLINFAHGEVYMIGAFVGLIMVAVYKVNFFLAMLAAMAVCVPLAVLIERVAYRPLRRSTRLAPLISALGVSIFLQTLVTLIKGGPNPLAFPQVIQDTVYVLGPVKFSTIQVIILVVASLLMVFLQFTIKYTKIGKAMRATSEDYEIAGLMGINVNNVVSFTFAIGAALAAAGRCAGGYVFLTPFIPLWGFLWVLSPFARRLSGESAAFPEPCWGGSLSVSRK